MSELNPELVVERFPSEKDWTLSEYFLKGVKLGVGVEDEARDVKVKGETRIPNGIYEIDVTFSPAFSKSFYVDKDGYLSKTNTDRFNEIHPVILVKNVPNFSGIRWHWGNTDDDSLGCYIVGKSFATFGQQKGVASSKVAYMESYPLIFQLIAKNKELGLKTYVEYKDK